MKVKTDLNKLFLNKEISWSSSSKMSFKKLVTHCSKKTEESFNWNMIEKFNLSRLQLRPIIRKAVIITLVLIEKEDEEAVRDPKSAFLYYFDLFLYMSEKLDEKTKAELCSHLAYANAG